MNTILFSLPGNQSLTHQLAKKLDIEEGQFSFREFPDCETYIRIQTPVAGKKVILVCTLDRPDDKLLPLYFLAKTLKDQGAKHICLLAPYLAYMRQDKIFKPGEAVTAKYFASLISSFADSLITVDPHLHRISKLEEVYSIPTKVVHAAQPVANWIKANVQNPILVGPDSESHQWVSEVASLADLPFIVLEKVRKGDRDVTVSIPQVAEYKNHTPVLIDDIISTARTMMQTVKHLLNAGMKAPVCVGVHAIFVSAAYLDLMATGIEKVVTCNTVEHYSNAIDLSELYLDVLTDEEGSLVDNFWEFQGF